MKGFIVQKALILLRRTTVGLKRFCLEWTLNASNSKVVSLTKLGCVVCACVCVCVCFLVVAPLTVDIRAAYNGCCSCNNGCARK